MPTYIELQITLSKAQLLAVGLGSVLSHPVGNVLVHVHYHLLAGV